MRSTQALKQQTITETQPGTVLRDFQMLLDFIGLEGIPTSGKHRLLPLSKLAEIDERMTHPLQPRLKRPQQVSYPHLHGLYLLLRASGLGIDQGTGKAGRLLLEPELFEQWQELNPTERYFNLLEAWLFRSNPSMLGERDDPGRMAVEAINMFQHTPTSGLTATNADTLVRIGIWKVTQYYRLALMELFGLLAVDREEPREGENWRITAVRHTPFGDAIVELLMEDFVELLSHDGLVVETHADEDEPNVRRFGLWQPRLQPYFPEWQKNLVMKPPEFREGLYEFKAALAPNLWRRIAISSYAALDELALAIIDAYDFDGDHLYEFTFREPDKSTVRVGLTEEEDVHTEDIQVGYLPLAEGQSMKFVYDFGAWWEFEVTLEKVRPFNEGEEDAAPKVVAQKGQAPDEYGHGDDDDDDDDDDDGEFDDEDE